ncbi:MAG: CobW-like GTP-binding protein [Pseudomonas sp.]|uniref:CobW family GTP-binding protein n=1 Tax=Pseudomonas sp. TaxID=306 RepID=UPI00339120E3
MLKQIPTHLIAGPLGAGKTSLIRQLLRQRPAGERWAVLINEFGQIGIDAALLSTGDSGVRLAEVAGGCLCCVNGAPFQVGLARLLRQARPDRLLIEPSGLGHPVQLLQQLRQPPWAGVLAVQPSVMVLDAVAMAAGQALPDSQRAALEAAGLLLLNKADGLDAATRQRILEALPRRPLQWTRDAELRLLDLPGMQAVVHDDAVLADGPQPAPALATLWIDPAQPICHAQGQADGWSIGWRWHPSQRFDRERVQHWLASQAWRRAKLVLLTEQGWSSGNALDGAPIQWRSSEWRRDSRLELILEDPPDVPGLSDGLACCRL